LLLQVTLNWTSGRRITPYGSWCPHASLSQVPGFRFMQSRCVGRPVSAWRVKHSTTQHDPAPDEVVVVCCFFPLSHGRLTDVFGNCLRQRHTTAMNAHIQAQLDLVEAALNTLIDSITSYNPSPSAAVALVAADDDLTEGLEQCNASLRAPSSCRAHPANRVSQYPYTNLIMPLSFPSAPKPRPSTLASSPPYLSSRQHAQSS